MNAIVSVTNNWGIGLNGQLVVRNRADMRMFREQTMGGTVVCGRTTFEGFPGGALKGRRNIVLTHDPNYTAQGAEVVHSTAEALRTIEHDDPDHVWLIGGQSVYEALLGACTKAYVTKNDVTVAADAFFPNLDALPTWTCAESLESGTTDTGIGYEFLIYEQHR